MITCDRAEKVMQAILPKQALHGLVDAAPFPKSRTSTAGLCLRTQLVLSSCAVLPLTLSRCASRPLSLLIEDMISTALKFSMDQFSTYRRAEGKKAW